MYMGGGMCDTRWTGMRAWYVGTVEAYVGAMSSYVGTVSLTYALTLTSGYVGVSGVCRDHVELCRAGAQIRISPGRVAAYDVRGRAVMCMYIWRN
jgi:hypothetical protein